MPDPISNVEVPRIGRVSWRGAAALAGGSVWLPALLPFVFGPASHAENARIYAHIAPVHVGFLFGQGLAGPDSPLAFYLLASVATLVVLGLLTIMIRELSRWAALPAAVLAGANALLLGFLCQG